RRRRGWRRRRRRRRRCRAAEVVGQRRQRRVRAQVGVVLAAPGGRHAEVLDVEEAILQAEVEALGDRDTDAGQQLPREAAVVVVGEQPLAAGAVTLQVELGVDADPAVTGTTADE